MTRPLVLVARWPDDGSRSRYPLPVSCIGSGRLRGVRTVKRGDTLIMVQVHGDVEPDLSLVYASGRPCKPTPVRYSVRLASDAAATVEAVAKAAGVPVSVWIARAAVREANRWKQAT